MTISAAQADAHTSTPEYYTKCGDHWHVGQEPEEFRATADADRIFRDMREDGRISASIERKLKTALIELNLPKTFEGTAEPCRGGEQPPISGELAEYLNGLVPGFGNALKDRDAERAAQLLTDSLEQGLALARANDRALKQLSGLIRTRALCTTLTSIEGDRIVVLTDGFGAPHIFDHSECLEDAVDAIVEHGMIKKREYGRVLDALEEAQLPATVKDIRRTPCTFVVLVNSDGRPEAGRYTDHEGRLHYSLTVPASLKNLGDGIDPETGKAVVSDDRFRELIGEISCSGLRARITVESREYPLNDGWAGRVLVNSMGKIMDNGIEVIPPSDQLDLYERMFGVRPALAACQQKAAPEPTKKGGKHEPASVFQPCVGEIGGDAAKAAESLKQVHEQAKGA